MKMMYQHVTIDDERGEVKEGRTLMGVHPRDSDRGRVEDRIGKPGK
jgi:hypothetical protein